MKRTHVLLDAEAATNAGTKTIDLDGLGLISRIWVEMRLTNNNSVPTAHPAKTLSKIEVVDGSDVIASANGYETQAAEILQTGQVPFSELDWENDITCFAVASLYFGRHAWDRKFALDPARFANPQLKITHDRSLGGSAPDAATLTVWAEIMDDSPVKPIGLLSLREVFQYSLVNSAKQTIDLPVDRVMRRLIIQSLSSGKMPHDQYNKIKLTLDDDRRVLLNDVKTSDYVKFPQASPLFVEGAKLVATTSAATFYCTPTYATLGSVQSYGTTQGGALINESYGGTYTVDGENAEGMQVQLQGKAPHGAVAVPFGDQNDETDWLSFANFKKFQAILTASSSVGSSSTCQLIAETLRRY